MRNGEHGRIKRTSTLASKAPNNSDDGRTQQTSKETNHMRARATVHILVMFMALSDLQDLKLYALTVPIARRVIELYTGMAIAKTTRNTTQGNGTAGERAESTEEEARGTRGNTEGARSRRGKTAQQKKRKQCLCDE